MDAKDTAKWVSAAQRGDTRAFAALCKAHYGLVYALALSTVGERTAAQDIAQDTFVIAWSHLGELRAAGAFPMWIRKIARNLALNWVRSAEYRRKLIERYRQTTPEPQASGEDATQALAREERRAAVWTALQQLSPPVREAMVLFYLEGHSVSEAARLLGVSENALKLRLHTGRARQRKLFEEQVEESLYRDFLPPDATGETNRILAGLAMGPAMPQLGTVASGPTWELWLHHIFQNGVGDTLAPVLKGGLAVHAKKAALGVVVGTLCVGGAFWGLSRFGNQAKLEGENWRRVPGASQRAAGDGSSAEGAPQTQLRRTAEASQTYRADDKPVTNTAPVSLPEDRLEVRGDMSVSATLLQQFDTGRIKDPADFVSISGVVVDTHGAPVAGATVQAVAAGRPNNPEVFDPVGMLAVQQNPAHAFTATTDTSGRFHIEGIAYEGTAVVTAMADGYSMDRRNAVHVHIKPRDAVSGVRITLEPGKGLRGKLLAPDGTPVSDGVVNLVAYRSRAEFPNGNLGRTNTDANGMFHIALPREGVAYLVTSSLKHGTASFDEVPVGTDDLIELKMPESARLTGTITWENGGPASNVYVFLIGKATDGRGQNRVPATVYAAQTDGSGAYTIELIDTKQSYAASVAAPDRSPLSQPEPLPEFKPGATQTWDYVIQESITVRGRVVGETTGKPLANVKVAALKDGQPVQDSETPVSSDGSYEMRLFSGAGQYVIYPRLWRIEPTTTGYDWGKQVALTPGQEETVNLTFMDTATIAIRVIDSVGQPVEGVMLGIREDDHTWLPVARTPADGRFTYAGVMPGVETNFVVHDASGEIGSTTPVVAEPGQIFPEETVVVYGSAGLEGIAVGSDGQLLANGVLMVRALYALTRQVERRVNTDATGHFVIEAGLPATAVILEIDGYVEREDGVSRYQHVSEDMMLLDGEILNLGNVVFHLEESNLDIGER